MDKAKVEAFKAEAGSTQHAISSRFRGQKRFRHDRQSRLGIIKHRGRGQAGEEGRGCVETRSEDIYEGGHLYSWCAERVDRGDRVVVRAESCLS